MGHQAVQKKNNCIRELRIKKKKKYENYVECFHLKGKNVSCTKDFFFFFVFLGHMEVPRLGVK